MAAGAVWRPYVAFLVAATVFQTISPALSKQNVVAYVPDYRFDSVDWQGVLTHTTHLILFSFGLGPEAQLLGTEVLSKTLQDGSKFTSAVKTAKKPAKVLICLGGTGHSQNFAAVLKSRKLRAKLIEQLQTLFDRRPYFSGIDIDWQVPGSQDDLRSLSRLAKELRIAFASRKGGFLVTTTVHMNGMASVISAIHGKKDNVPMVDLFDMFHALVYSSVDHERKHMTGARDREGVQQWVDAGLPASKLTLGIPLFGIHKVTGDAQTYGEILDGEPSLQYRIGADESKTGYWFANARSVNRKVKFAAEAGLAGVMLWEAGQDKPVSNGASLLGYVWRATFMNEELPPRFTERLWAITTFGENEMFAFLAALIGFYLAVQAVTAEMPRDKLQPPIRLERRTNCSPDCHHEAACATAQCQDANESCKQDGQPEPGVTCTTDREQSAQESNDVPDKGHVEKKDD